MFLFVEELLLIPLKTPIGNEVIYAKITNEY